MLLFSNINDALLLIVLCMGYMVLYFAKREEKELRLMGYIIGCIVITLAAIFLIFAVCRQASIGCRNRWIRSPKRMMQQRMMHPQMMPEAPIQKP